MYSYQFCELALKEFARLNNLEYYRTVEIYRMLKFWNWFHDWMETYAMKGV